MVHQFSLRPGVFILPTVMFLATFVFPSLFHFHFFTFTFTDVDKSDSLPIQLAAGCLCLANSLFGGYAAFREVGLPFLHFFSVTLVSFATQTSQSI